MQFEDFINIMKKDPMRFCLTIYTIVHKAMLFFYEGNLIL